MKGQRNIVKCSLPVDGDGDGISDFKGKQNGFQGVHIRNPFTVDGGENITGLNAFGGAVFGLAEVGVLLMVLLPLLATFADGWLQEGLQQSFLTQKLLQTDLPSIFQSVNGG